MKSKIIFPLIVLLLASSICSFYSTVAAVTVQTNISSQPLPGYSLIGQAPSDLLVLVNIAIPLRNTDLLSSILRQVSDPSSPSFRHFLTPAQMEQQFLPKTEDESMISYLQSIGLKVLSNSLDSMIIAQATVTQVKEYLHANVIMYTNGSQSYYITTGNSMLNGAHFLASNSTTLFAKPHMAYANIISSNRNITFTQGGFSAKDLQTVYNATALYQQGFHGEGQTIGILDFFGSPTITQDLIQYDRMLNLPDPIFNIIPITPNYPNLGVSTGWSTEVALDVESAHTMAPNAGIDLYLTNGALSFAADIAPIVNLAQDNTLSMSFSLAPEWLFPDVGGPLFYFNMLLPDQYFMIGNLEGITFLTSSGDAGGSGDSTGPAGNLGYPDDSPYVTCVGGTQTYLSDSNGSKTFIQTGWSNPTYVPNGINTGGSGGGVSFLEPKPWYQQNIPTPPSYPNGRMEPDLSLQGGIAPGIFIVDGGSTIILGGTSASVQLLSGLLTLIAQSAGGPLGLINPFLYNLGNDDTLYTKAYNPITFGYTIPWTASFGYNLVTGWGAPNIGAISNIYNTQLSQPSLSVFVSLTDSTGQTPTEFTPDQTIFVTANIFNGASPVTSGSVTANLVTLTRSSHVTPMTFNNNTLSWNCSLTASQQSGIALVNVNVKSNNFSGEGFAETFAGYLATFFMPTPTDPLTTTAGLQVVMASSDLNGNPAPLNSTTMQVNSYTILSNTYTTVDTVNLTLTNITGLSNVMAVNLTAAYPAGPMNLILEGNTYGFLPFMNGIYLQTSTVFPEVIVEPGSVGPGQYLGIVTSPIAPANVAGIFSLDSGGTVGSDVASGSNVTAFLVNPLGNTVASSVLVNQGSAITGLLQIPANSKSGLYTILLQATFGSLTLGYTLNGAFYEQVWVSNGTITPQITFSPSVLYMGQSAQISVDIRYPNGQEVTQGEYTAIIYPQELQNQYTTIMYNEYLNHELTPLTYNSTLNRWIANITLPSPYNSGAISPVNNNSFYYAGPYETYVTGISYDGVPTTTALAAEQNFLIQPYTYVANQLITSFQQNWGLALSGDTIIGSVNLSNVLFIGSNLLQSGTILISDSTLSGTIFVTGSTLTLLTVHGGNIVATNSSINLKNSDITSIVLTNSTLALSSSTYQTIIPTPPTIAIQTPVNGSSYNGNVNANITVSGSNVALVTVYLNGQQIQTSTNNGTLTFTIPSSNYPDGTYSMQVVAAQTDGISSSVTETMYFTNQATTTQSEINTLNSTQSNLSNTISSLNNQISSLTNSINTLNSMQSTIQNQIGNLQGTISSLSSSQTALQNQVSNMGNELSNLNSTQAALQNQLNDLGSNFNSSMSQLRNQTTTFQNNLNNAELLTAIGIGIGIAGITIAIGVATIMALRRRR